MLWNDAGKNVLSDLKVLHAAVTHLIFQVHALDLGAYVGKLFKWSCFPGIETQELTYCTIIK